MSMLASLCLCPCLCLCISMSLCLCLYLPLHLLCLCISPSMSICLCLSLSVCPSASQYVHVSLCVCLCFHLQLALSMHDMSLCISISLCLCLYPSASPCVSVPPSASEPASPCVSVCLSHLCTCQCLHFSLHFRPTACIPWPLLPLRPGLEQAVCTWNGIYLAMIWARLSLSAFCFLRASLALSKLASCLFLIAGATTRSESTTI